MKMSQIVREHDDGDAFATVQKCVDYADEYNVLFGFRHQWLWDNGDQVRGDVNTDGLMNVYWTLDGEPDGFTVDVSDKERV